MKIRKLNLFYFLVIFSGALHSQEEVQVFKPFISVGTGLTYASVNSWQENSSRKLNPGIHTMMGFHLKRFFYIEAASNYYFIHKSSPAFNRIHAWGGEVNAHFLLRINEKLFYKIILGGAYLDWKGTYSGRGLNGSSHYVEGDLVHSEFVEGNIGMGFTRKIGNRSYIDLSETMRFSSFDHGYGLTDISLQLGYRYVLRFKKEEKPASGNGKVKTEKGIPKGKYKWMKKKRR